MAFELGIMSVDGLKWESGWRWSMKGVVCI